MDGSYTLVAASMAVFELPSTAAGAGGVAGLWLDVGREFYFLLSLDLHDHRGRVVALQQLGHDLHRAVDVAEKQLVAFAEVVQTGFAVGTLGEAVFGASAVADETHIAFAAIAGQGIAFCLAKSPLLLAGHELAERRFVDIAQPVFGFDIVVAGIEVAAVFQSQSQSAGWLEDTQTRFVAGPGGEGFVEDLDVNAPDIVPYPFTKDRDKEFAILASTDRRWNDLLTFLVTGLVVPQDDGDELDVDGAGFVTQEPVDFEGGVGVALVDTAQDVVLDLVLLEQGQPTHRLVEGRAAAFAHPVAVVEIPRAIEAEPDQEVVFLEKVAPFIVKGRAVGLQGIDDLKPRFAVFSLETERFFKKLDSHQGGFAALPGKGDFLALLCGNVIPDVVFQRLVRHAEVAAGKQFFLGEIVAVIAIEITDRSAWLDHDMETLRVPFCLGWVIRHGFS